MAGASKVIDLRGFSDYVFLHSGLPHVLGWPAVVFLPWLELTCGICLAVGYATREAAAILSGLLVLFLAYSLLHLGGADRHCFLLPRVVDQSPWWWAPLRNLLLLLCSVQVARKGIT